MADDSKRMTIRNDADTENVSTPRIGTNIECCTVEVAAGADAGSVYTGPKLPLTCRLHGISMVAWDDLASTGSPTLDIGITGDDDCLVADIDLTSAATTAVSAIADHANWGKELWELAGLTLEQSKQRRNVILTIKDAACNTGGTVSMSLAYSID